MCHGESGSAGAEAHSRRYSRFRDVRLSCSSLCQIWFGKECFQCCELPDENLPFGDKPSFRHALFPDGNDSPFRKTGQKYSLLLMLLQKNHSFTFPSFHLFDVESIPYKTKCLKNFSIFIDEIIPFYKRKHLQK